MVVNIGVTHPDYVMVKNVSEFQDQDQDETPEGGGGSTNEENPVQDTEGSSDVSGHSADVAKEGVNDVRAKGSGEMAEEEKGDDDGAQAHEKKVERSTSEELLQPTIQALAVLSNVSRLKRNCMSLTTI